MRTNHIFRRSTLSALFGIFVAIMLCAAPAGAFAKKKKIGIQLYSVMGAMEKDPVGSVERLAGMGYNVFELVQWGGNPKVFGMEAKDFKALCDKHGIDIVSTHSSIQEDPAKEEEIMQSWRRLFEIQRTCGGEYFVIPSYRVDYTVEALDQMCSYLNRVGKIAKEYGLKLGYHNHAQEYEKLKGTDLVMWEYLVENTDPEYVCFELDVYWCGKGNKNPVDYLKKYPKRIKMLHIKDEFVIGESGNVDFPAIFKQFRKNGMKDFVVEIETPRSLREKKNADGSKLSESQILDEKFEAARLSVEYLRKAKLVK